MLMAMELNTAESIADGCKIRWLAILIAIRQASSLRIFIQEIHKEVAGKRAGKVAVDLDT